MHHIGDLKLNDELNKLAHSYAYICAERKAAIASKTQYNGEYLGESCDPIGGCPTITRALPTDKWYKRFQYYDFSNPGYSSSAAPFAQILWKDTKEVRFGILKNYTVRIVFMIAF